MGIPGFEFICNNDTKNKVVHNLPQAKRLAAAQEINAQFSINREQGEKIYEISEDILTQSIVVMLNMISRDKSFDGIKLTIDFTDTSLMVGKEKVKIKNIEIVFSIHNGTFKFVFGNNADYVWKDTKTGKQEFLSI